MTDEVDFNLWTPSPAPVARQKPARPRRRPWRIVYWVTFGLLCAAAVGLLVGAVMVTGVVRISSSTMAPPIQPGSRVIFQRGASGIVRGDVVVVRPPGDYGVLVRRVIGLPGDRVACCDSAGSVTVDGEALIEDYLAPGSAPSQTKFAVTLGPGQVWVMGDYRAITVDSRSWGPLAMSGVAGRVIEVSGSRGNSPVRTPATFTAGGLAPYDHRFPLPMLLVLLATLAILAVIVQGTAGAVRWGVRRSRREPRKPPRQTATWRQSGPP